MGSCILEKGLIELDLRCDYKYSKIDLLTEGEREVIWWLFHRAYLDEMFGWPFDGLYPIRLPLLLLV
jgi:hypothetical protein